MVGVSAVEARLASRVVNTRAGRRSHSPATGGKRTDASSCRIAQAIDSPRRLRSHRVAPNYFELGEASYEDVVDKLLASSHFGEKWGRHWLDIARYADSNGSSFNPPFQEAWRYRNWVVDAFNADLPIDRFIQMQIAGDLLPYATQRERDDNLIATGYLMLGSKVLGTFDKEQINARRDRRTGRHTGEVAVGNDAWMCPMP